MKRLAKSRKSAIAAKPVSSEAYQAAVEIAHKALTK